VIDMVEQDTAREASAGLQQALQQFEELPPGCAARSRLCLRRPALSSSRPSRPWRRSPRLRRPWPRWTPATSRHSLRSTASRPPTTASPRPISWQSL